MSTYKEALKRSNTYEEEGYDIAVIGAGHAGCEAALAAARLGMKTILFGINLDSVANMPCNPSIGGTAKGQLVREIDALGGEMGRAADETFIQSRMLNSSKGPAVLSPRAQIDRRAYQKYMKTVIEKQPLLTLRQGEIIEILYKKNRGDNKAIQGVVTRNGAVHACKAAVLTTGTFMEARIVIGEVSYSGGPDGLFPSAGLSGCLKKMGIEMTRFKTGTPVRVNISDIDLSGLEEQKGDNTPCLFSFENEGDASFNEKNIKSCWVTWSTEETKDIIMDNIHRSPLFSGEIEGVGPRYCPSIEDKIVKFPNRDRHQIFIEPTGKETDEMYIQGLSSSMPEDVQVKMLRSVPGLGKGRIMRSAYAIEYDCIVPTSLEPTLEHSKIKGLFFAGQVNGSSGYEEAAGQGIMAGINASRMLSGKSPVILDRSQAYIGVLIDDLVTKGTPEPYRMMTSRAEYRLLLRQDNADERLTPIGHRIGLVGDKRYEAYLKKQHQISLEIERLKKTVIKPDRVLNDILVSLGSSPVKTGQSLATLIRRPEIAYSDLKPVDMKRPDLSDAVCFEVQVKIKYEGYISLENERIEKFKKLEHKKIPGDISYDDITGLRTEARQKLEKIRPGSVGRASRISGVSPADISVILVYLASKRKADNA